MEKFSEVLKPKSALANNLEFYVFLPNNLTDIKAVTGVNRKLRFCDAVTSKNAGNASFLAKSYDAAICHYDEAIKILEEMDDKLCAPELSVCYQNRSAAKAHKNDYVGSIADVSSAIELNEHYSKAYFRRGQIYYHQKKYYRALQDILQACVLERFKNKTYNNMVIDILAGIDQDTFEKQWKKAYDEMDAAKLHCDHCLNQQLMFVKNCGILDPIIVPIPKNQPSSGYIRAMKGLKELNITDIVDGCKEEQATKGLYLAQSLILKAYMNMAVIPSHSFSMEEWSKDMQRMDVIIADAKYPQNIKFNAKLCLANLYNRSGLYSDADRELTSLKGKYDNSGPFHITKSGALFQFGVTQPHFFEALKKCCNVLPHVFELQFQRVNAAAKQISNGILSTAFFMNELEELIKRFPREVAPRMLLVTFYEKFDKEKAKKILKKAKRDLPERSEEMLPLYGLLNPKNPSCVKYYKQSLKFNKDDPCSLEGLLDYFELTTHEYAKAIEVSTKAMFSFLQEDDFKDMFQRRQILLKRIVGQDFWNRL